MTQRPGLLSERRTNKFGDRTAVITGGGSGVGESIALALAAEGAKLCLVGRRLENLEVVAAKVAALGSSAACCRVDLEQDDQVLKLVQEVTADVGGVDMLIHSAGTIERASIEAGSLRDFDSHYRVNVRAAYALTQGLLPSLKSRRGEVVFINSSSGITAKAFFSQYDASKHALRALADSLRAEVNESGVRVLSIFLGQTASNLQARLHDKEHKLYRPELLLQPDDVASAVVNALGLPRSAEITDIHIRPMIKS